MVPRGENFQLPRENTAERKSFKPGTKGPEAAWQVEKGAMYYQLPTEPQALCWALSCVTLLLNFYPEENDI